MQLIFTASLGRSGTLSLSDVFNRFGIECVAEHEPPAIPLLRFVERARFVSALPGASLLGSLWRRMQRRYFTTYELVGRGRALEWYDAGDIARLRSLVTRRLRRLEPMARRGVRHYVECSQFFIRTFAEETIRQVPDLGVIKLTRDPLECARSLDNRSRGLFANVLPPDRPSNLCQVQRWQDLSRFQIFALQWIEQELRFQRFVENHPGTRTFELRTKELSDPVQLDSLFAFFGIEHRPFHDLRPLNIGSKVTRISKVDRKEFLQLLDRLPAGTVDRVPRLAARAGDLARGAAE